MFFSDVRLNKREINDVVAVIWRAMTLLWRHFDDNPVLPTPFHTHRPVELRYQYHVQHLFGLTQDVYTDLHW